MDNDLTRRTFLGVAGITAATAALPAGSTAAAQDNAPPAKPMKIVGIACSPRQGQSTAAALQVCLEAARQVDPANIEIELIELAGKKINGAVAAGVPLAEGEVDDFPALVPKMADPRVAGIVIATPVYFANMSSLCKAFLERWMAFRKDDFSLANKVAGVLAVGGSRNGGAELTIQSVQAALFSQELIVVGESRPTAHFGPVVWNQSDRKVTDDEIGMTATKALGRRVAEVAQRLHSC
ncbi:MAG: flavodoxin family protein [Planctomycetia bacterium]|nr:flavodoxin family protein [Planctomycetia bacterium]